MAQLELHDSAYASPGHRRSPSRARQVSSLLSSQRGEGDDLHPGLNGLAQQAGRCGIVGHWKMRGLRLRVMGAVRRRRSWGRVLREGLLGPEAFAAGGEVVMVGVRCRVRTTWLAGHAVTAPFAPPVPLRAVS